MAPARYVTPAGPQAEYEPGSRGRVLCNRLGIQRKRVMDRAEHAVMMRARSRWLGRIARDTRFKASLLCQMHRDWLGGIYEWAGQYRTVELAKGGFRWPPAYLIPRHMANFERGILRENTPCRSGRTEQVARCIAQVHAELLLIHPFREGNGRLARWLADLMAFQAGLPPPAYRLAGKGANARKLQYLEAVSRGYLRDYGLLEAFFLEAFERRAREGGDS